MYKNVGRFGNTTCARSVNGGADSFRADVGLGLDCRLNGQRLSSNNVDSRTDACFHTENYSRLRGNFDFRTVDVEYDGRIFLKHIYEYSCANNLENLEQL